MLLWWSTKYRMRGSHGREVGRGNKDLLFLVASFALNCSIDPPSTLDPFICFIYTLTQSHLHTCFPLSFLFSTYLFLTRKMFCTHTFTFLSQHVYTFIYNYLHIDFFISFVFSMNILNLGDHNILQLGAPLPTTCHTSGCDYHCGFVENVVEHGSWR